MMDKAKAYDEALEKAKQDRDAYQKELDKTDKNSQLASILKAGISALEMVFPQLKESDDERIRKDIIDHFESIKAQALYDNQEESDNIISSCNEKIAWLKAIPLNRKKHNEDAAKRCSNEWSEEDERLYKCVLKTLELWAEGKLYQYIIPSNTDRYINFFKSLKFRVQPQSKQEWSKKDEEMLWNIISIVGQSKSIKADEMLDWLKSLRPSWKPTKEHIDAIEECLEFYAESTDTYRHLKSLLSELVKLQKKRI